MQRPDGSTTHFYYSDGLTGNATTNGLHYFINTATQLDSTRVVDSYRFYDGRGEVTQTFDNWTSANGWSTQDIEYDVMGRAYRASNPYYSGGYGWRPVNPDGFWMTKSFDNLGRVKDVTTPRGDDNNQLTTTAHMDYAGTVITVTDQAGKQRRQLTDALGRVVRLDEPDASGNLGTTSAPTQATSYEYDILDNLIHITQPGPNSITQNRYFKYDSLSRLTHERQVEQAAPWTTTDSVAGNNQWSRKIVYNSQSLVQDAYDARQLNTHFVYDGLNRVSQINYNLPGGSPDPATPSAYYWYDSQTPSGAPAYNHGSAMGRLTAMTYGGITATTGNYFGYDQMGRVNVHRQVTGSNTYSMSYGYNVGGLLTSETYHSGRVVNYAYDEGGRLSQVSDGATTYASGLTYEPHGGLSSETFGNGAVHSVAYNRALQASEIKLRQSVNGAELQRYNYFYGTVNQADGSVDTSKNNGQIGRIDGTINGAGTKEWDQRFSYDSLGRLSTAAEYKQGNNSQRTWQTQYTYDRFGNRFQSGSENSGVGFTTVVTGDIDANTNRFVTTGATPTTYDPAGNILTDTKFRGMNFNYDANGRQTFAEHTDHTGQQTSIYDCAGQRVQTTTNGVTRTMVYDIFGQDVADYSSGALERENLYRGGQLLATQDYPQITTQNVTWTNTVGVAVNGNSIGKSAVEGWGNAGAVSTQAIATGDGYADFTADGLGYGMFGLSHGDTDQSYQDIDYALYIELGPNTIYVFENGVNKGVVGTYTWGDRFRVAVEGGVVKYRKNGTRLYTSAVAPTFPLLVDTSLYSNNGWLLNVVISGNLSGNTGGLKYVLQDVQGSTRAVMNNNVSSGTSTIIVRHDYLPFGEEISSGTGLRVPAQGYGATDTNRQKYGLTERDDATGLDHTWWRKYESFSGRMTTPDPYRGSMSIANPQSFNRYSYVQNDPVNFIDPSGLDEKNPPHLPPPPGPPPYTVIILISFLDFIRSGGGGGNEFGTPQGPANPWADALPKLLWLGGGAQQKKGSGFVKLSKEDCAALLNEINRLADIVKRRGDELINDALDFEARGMTKEIENHMKSFKDARVPLNEALDKYDKHCKGGPPPSREARERAGQPVPRRTRAPNAPAERSSRWLCVIPPVLVGLACIICPECCAVAVPVVAIP